MLDLQTVTDHVMAFRDKRDWKQFHNAKDLAIAISVEASELLEAFRWSGTEITQEGHEDEIEEELADVLIYCLYLADTIGADPLEIIERKLDANEVKYPVERAYGTSRKYTEL